MNGEEPLDEATTREVLADVGEALGFETRTFEHSEADVEWKGRLENFCKMNFRFFVEKDAPDIEEKCEFSMPGFKPVVVERKENIEEKREELDDFDVPGVSDPVFLELERLDGAWEHLEKVRREMEKALM